MRQSYIYCLLFFLLCNLKVQSQSGVWTWMHGDNFVNSLGIYGTQGVSTSFNKPPSRYQAAYWTDQNGDFWLFGGSVIIGGVGQVLNDLWKFNVASNQWTWVKGPILNNDQNGAFGTIGVGNVNNYPSARGFGSNCWTDNNGDLWLYGGKGYDAVGNFGVMGDLWKYNIASNQWTWVKGANLINQNAVYGIQGVANIANRPGAIYESKSGWVDANNDLWMFGGSKNDVANDYYSDMWKYNIASNSWTWVKGFGTINGVGNYGTLGVEDPANLPPARWSYTKWKGVNNNFYIFAGQTYNGGSLGTYNLNDMWQYNPITNNWTWVSGNSGINHYGIYTTPCNSSNAIYPAARFDNQTAQTVGCSEVFWSFGGRSVNGSRNDLWLYNLTTNEWTWVSGSNNVNQPAVYGTLGVPNSSNMIQSKYGTCVWVDNSNNLWVFGGKDLSNGFNDMWRYTPDTTCFNAPLIANFKLFPPTDSVICAGDTAKMFSAISSTLIWNPSINVYPNVDSTIINFVPTTTTTYTVTGVDSGLCPGVDTIIFTITVISNSSNLIPPQDSLLCEGETTSMNINPNLTITYSPTNSVSPNIDTSILTFSPTTTTTYTVNASFGNCGQVTSSVFTIFVNPKDVVQLNQPSQVNLCVSDTSTMFINPAYSVFYNPAIGVFPNVDTSILKFSPPNTTNYTVTASSNGVCPDTASVSFTINAIPITKINLPNINDTSVCRNHEIVISLPIDVENFYLNNWTDAQTNQDSNVITIKPTSTQSYQLVAFGGNCTVSDTISFTVTMLPSPISSFEITPDSINLSNAIFTLKNTSTGANSIRWFQNAQLLSIANTFSKKINQLGEVCFELEASNNGGCKDTSRNCVFVLDDPTQIFVPNAFSPNGDGVNDYFEIYAANIEVKEFAIFDRWGNEVFRYNNGFWGWDGKLKSKEMPAAVYFYYIKYIQKGETKELKGDLTLLR